MDVRKINLIYFSPTRTTQQVLDGFSASFPDKEFTNVDMTYPDNIPSINIPADELAIIGVPVYAGRVAPAAANRLKLIQGNGTPAVIVVVYGNREYEDALIELKGIAEDIGFKPLAACTFIGEHSFSEEETPIAAGRPDIEDLQVAKQYGAEIWKVIQTAQDLEGIGDLNVPGNIPYKDGVGNLPFSPSVNVGLCTHCGECVTACPTGALSLNDEVEIDVGTCIFCCSCKKSCPEAAISIEAPPIREKTTWLSQNCSDRKEPQLFL
jgi:ferredoxin